MNCDRFIENSNPKFDIPIIVKSTKIAGAKVFAIFEDINSMTALNYCRNSDTNNLKFHNIPIGQKGHILAIFVNEDIPMIFQTVDTTIINQENIQLDFVATSKAEIISKLKFFKK